jgi:hypothetical protein
MYGCLAEIRLHYLLRDTCKALEFSQEDIEHGTKARELFKQHYFALDEDKRTPPRGMLDMSADILEELGMLKEALACDQALYEHMGTQSVSAIRRHFEALLCGGFEEVKLHHMPWGCLHMHACKHIHSV